MLCLQLILFHYKHFYILLILSYQSNASEEYALAPPLVGVPDCHVVLIQNPAPEVKIKDNGIDIVCKPLSEM